LAYKTDIYAWAPLDRQWIFIDAASGNILEKRDRIRYITVPGEAQCFYHGLQTIHVDSVAPIQFLLRDNSRADGIITLDLNGSSNIANAVDFVDTDNFWDTTTDFDHAAYDAHWATGLMFDYMLAEHNWNSYDNQGSAIRSYIHHSNNFNAAWTGTEVIYGDGDGTNFTPFTAAEVVGHEVMHAYSTSMFDFNFSNTETIALNEAYSDIFSVIVEHSISPSTANYILGDMITVNGQGVRSLENPNAFNHPDTYQGQFWNNANINGMAGVLNFCFYLLTQGGSGVNDNGDAYQVDALPMDEVADILFRSLSVYMTPNVDFADFRTWGIQSCIDLYGTCSEQEIQFTNACYAVGLGAAFEEPPTTEIQFSADPDVNEAIQFTSNASGAISWAWDFGDNSTSIEEMPLYIYQAIGTFEVVLMATYANGCVSSDTITIDISNTTSLQNIQLPDFTLFPNPASAYLRVEFSQPIEIDQVRVLNTLGQSMPSLQMQHISTTQLQLGLNELPIGVYILELQTVQGFAFYRKFYRLSP
ncbi:MAG: M4 family metallopeptidase, partial [Bacteroidota bacterium]